MDYAAICNCNIQKLAPADLQPTTILQQRDPSKGLAI